ncbi:MULTISPECIES: hypothetical protein [unclassified Janthinobacterium]|uniref:hypothetical protein n=1 Tax=unclassified Janthinobacterium TaxID=2610881 RepID=UPI00160E7B52|nr:MULTISPECIES: hypothetical protein [unclassified Janthinobacterium]MBB5606946.1 hypothetical protein [Janthinobacterium sp. S3T4]MBB5612004.1 hypothetical protein [Janthinobacterium sp. S3M3]
MRFPTLVFTLVTLTACSQDPEPAPAAPTEVPAAPAPTPAQAPPPTAIEPPTEFKAQPLSPGEEKRLIKAAQSQKTDDGATVLQVLQHAEKMRPRKFKLAGFDIFYQHDGKPSSVGICYWIGSHRLDDDKYCDIGYTISADHQTLKADVGLVTPEEELELSVSKLNRGRDRFLKEVDERYENECIDYDTKKKLC